MSTNSNECWACSYVDSQDQANCSVCSSSSSASPPETFMPHPSAEKLQWSMPVISATKLQRVWQDYGSEITQEWRERLDLIRTLNPRSPCASPEAKEPSLVPGNQTPSTILLQDSDHLESTPSITLTSASPSLTPTMNLTTWHTFEQRVWSSTDVHVTTLRSTQQKKHKGKRRNCTHCKRDEEVNRKWVEAMGMGETGEVKGKANLLGRGGCIAIGEMVRDFVVEGAHRLLR
jgi:hypothetical protein